MKQISHLLTNCPPYLLFLCSFGTVVAFSLFKLYGMLQGLGLGN